MHSVLNGDFIDKDRTAHIVHTNIHTDQFIRMNKMAKILFKTFRSVSNSIIIQIRSKIVGSVTIL